MARIGILGGGQLGVMLAESIEREGGSFEFYDPDPDAPSTVRFSALTTTASWSDSQALSAFFERCDRVTYETEHVPCEIFPSHALPKLTPSIHALRITQHRELERQFLVQHGLPCARFQIVQGEPDLPSEFSETVILKTCVGGYDGKGQLRTAHRALAVEFMSQTAAYRPWILEEVVPFEREVSCIVARSTKQTITFPIFENLHRNHILDRTLIPARISEEVASEVERMARKAADAMNVIGLLTVEFFVCSGGERILINEFAPRPHNSGHVTRVATQFSQFDALAKVLLDKPLVEPHLHSTKPMAMANLLGDLWSRETLIPTGDEEMQPVECLEVRLYDKREARPKRKMGHLTVEGTTAERALALAEIARDQFRARGCKP